LTQAGPGLGPAPTAGSSMSQRSLILRRDECIPPPNKMKQEIASAINNTLFHQKALAHVRNVNAKRNPSWTILAVTH
jgi:hypothetical protein